VFDAFFALEEVPMTGAAPPSPSPESPPAQFDDSGEAATPAENSTESQVPKRGGTRLLFSFFGAQTCLLLLEVIAAASLFLSQLTSHTAATTHSSAADDSAATAAAIQCLERQRLMCTRLLARIIGLATRSMQMYPALMHEVHLLSAQAQWTALLHAKCAHLQSLSLRALEEETSAGRGAGTVASFPHTFFLQALMDLTLSWARLYRVWEGLGISLPPCGSRWLCTR